MRHPDPRQTIGAITKGAFIRRCGRAAFDQIPRAALLKQGRRVFIRWEAAAQQFDGVSPLEVKMGAELSELCPSLGVQGARVAAAVMAARLAQRFEVAA